MKQDDEYTGVFNADQAHTDESPFCADMSCFCHENTDATAQTGAYVTNGLMTESEADRLYHGGNV